MGKIIACFYFYNTTERLLHIQAVWYEVSLIQSERRSSCYQTEVDVLGEKNTSTQETSCVIVNDKY